MGAREHFYKYFGPKIVEAVFELMFDEINILRQDCGLSPRTKEQAINALKNAVQGMQNYEAMESQKQDEIAQGRNQSGG